MPRILFAVFAASLLLVSGCSRNLSSSNYSANATGGKVLKGTVVSSRIVTIKKDQLSDNVLGGAAGGVAGGVAGSAIGKGKGQTGATVGGAIAGAVAGALLEDALSTSDGVEYIVKIDGQHARSKQSTTKKSVRQYSAASTEKDVSQSIETNTESDLISVVQQDQILLASGTKVYVIYSDDRPRVVPAQ
ncbi:MAG: glycine zipper 2TM domain-containing protein [Rickettsiales bacterium]|nr:glycine zipper 2TM domain-containing protein [Rickettsiales bacterium]